ncbi:MAG: tetratricopeptide repeat protein [Nocardiopsaceae bacterium]|nr:tetratricopeptide repeat protein [Nocardiopsaceae bacterium]
MSFVADDLVAWLVCLVADAGRRKLTTWVLGNEQERALRQAATAAVQDVVGELRPRDSGRADELAMVVSEVLSVTVPDASPGTGVTLLEALRAGVREQLAVLDDAGLTGTGKSSAQVLDLSAGVVAKNLAGRLVTEILARGACGGPLKPLADQLNHDETHLQGQLLEDMATGTREALVRLEARQALPVPAPEVRYSLPPDAAAFTGRDEDLGRITAAVRDATGTGGVVAIHAIGGMPGVGKTALAVHAAHLLADRFPDRQLFIDLHAHTPGQDPVPPEAALAGLLTSVGVDARYLPASLEGRVSLWRDRMAGKRALLVLDNAGSSAQVAPLLPGSAGCLVLITSRRHLGDLPGGVPLLLLEVLPPREAEAMFTWLAPRAAGGPDGAVAELAKLAGYLPLAVSLLARVYARHPAWTLADLAAETRESLLTLTAENDSVAAAFDVSWRNLDPGRQRFFALLGLHPGTTIDAYAAAALADVGLSEAAGQLEGLHGEGLLAEAGYRRYRMHDLIRRYAHDRAASVTGRSQALGRLLDYYQHTAAIAEARLARQTRPGPAPVVRTAPTAVPGLGDAAEALAWARAERGNLLACLDHVTAVGQHARVIALTAGIAALLRRDGPWADAITRHATAVQAAHHLGDRPGEACALRNLGDARRLAGEYPGAAEALEEALGIYRGVGDRLGEANALNFLGDVRRATGDFPGAAKALEEALDLFRSVGDRLGEAGALNFLGNVRRMTGEYPGAAEALEEALGMFRGVGDRLGEANALNFLGDVRRATGDFRGAAEALEEALGIYRGIGSRLGEANALGNLGEVRRATGDFRGAAEALEEALGIYCGIGNRGGEAEALNEAGTLCRVRGDLGDAEEYHRLALGLAREIGSAWDEAHALAGLGRCALVAGRAADAKAGLRQALEIFQRIGTAEAADVAAELDAITPS